MVLVWCLLTLGLVSAENASCLAPGCEPQEQQALLQTLNRHKSKDLVTLTCEGQEFIDCWSFYSAPDPTHGDVVYVPEQQALDENLYYVKDGVVYMNSTCCDKQPVKSIRIQSKQIFNPGHIFLIDIKHMPTGPGTWPAWWSFGPNWPNNGEIDTIETVSIEDRDHSTLHTSAGCSMYVSNPSLSTPNCVSGQGQSGCGVLAPAGSAGPKFNSNGGGVYATQWAADGIFMWFFPRGQIPANLDTGDTASWPEPYVKFLFGDSCPSWHFQQQQLVINLDFCGDWAGAVYPGGNEACKAFVQDPANVGALSDAYWAINYLKVLF